MKKRLSDTSLLWLWVLAFGLKLVGATADVSWHFKFLRETFAIPHVINIVGLALGFGLLIYQLVRHHRLDQKGFWITWAGTIVFLVAAPIDDLYHRIFGLDLTSWSPPHYALYTGTAIMILGVLRMTVGARERISSTHYLWLVSLLGLFFMEDVTFPLGQQEYGAVTVWLVQLGQWHPSADLLALVQDPYYHAYGMLVEWLYPVYLVGGYLFTMSVARQVTKLQWGATLTTVLYMAFRIVARLVFSGMDLPVSYVPLFVIAMAVAVDLFARSSDWRIRLPLTAVAGTGIVWLGGYLSPRFVPFTPLWPMNSWPLALGAAVVGLALAGAVANWLSERSVGKDVRAAA